MTTFVCIGSVQAKVGLSAIESYSESKRKFIVTMGSALDREREIVTR